MQMLRKVFLGISEKNKQKFTKKFAQQRKNFAGFLRVLEKKQLKTALCLRFFKENLMPINAMVEHVSFSTNPSVSVKNLKKVSKKVLT